MLKYPVEDCKAIKRHKYHEEISFLASHERRNKFIRNLTVSLEGNTLLLFKLVEKHGKILHSMIEEKLGAETTRRVFFVYGGTDAETREEIRAITELETNAIIVASYGTFSTGINIVNLHNIIFASPSKSRIRNLQSIGRGLRKGENKTKAVLYDIADDLMHGNHKNFTIKHFADRIKIYSSEQFNYKLYNTE